MKQKAQVVMLPTENRSRIYIGNDNKTLHFGDIALKSVDDTLSQHLYIISDEEIKEGDWCIDGEYMFQIIELWNKSSGKQMYSGNNPTNGGLSIETGYCKKIIATTDTSLTNIKGGFNFDKIPTEMPVESSLPQPSQGFIEKYIKEYNKGNIITDILVEYEIIKAPFEDENNPADITYKRKQLKVDKDNTITIYSVKDSWNKEEVIELLYKSRFHKDSSDEKFDSWIKVNL